MTNDQTTIVLKDSAGSYYLLPQAALERGRASVEARAVIEERFPALQAIDTADEDVQGYYAFLAGVVAGGAATLLGFGIGTSLRDDNLGPLIRATAAQFASQL